MTDSGREQVSKDPAYGMTPKPQSSILAPLYVVTVNYNSNGYLERLIQSLSPAGLVAGLIVVDHSPKINPLKALAPFPIKVLAQENRGYGAGVNTGLRQIKDRNAMVLVCNPDVELLSPEAMPGAVTFMQDNRRVAFLAPRLVNKDLQLIGSCRRFYTFSSIITGMIPYTRSRPRRFRAHHFYMDTPVNGNDVEWASGSAFITRRSLFPSTLRFDERFFLYFEDVDLCTQIHDVGLSVVQYPELVFKHQEQRRSWTSGAHMRMHVTSLIKYITKYRGLPKATNIL